MSELRFEEIGTIEYLDAWELQKQIHQRVVDREQDDTVLLLEHPPTYTAGKRTQPHERPADPGGAPVIDVDRGGFVTFHGPGQVVAYPIVRLPEKVKVVDFVRRLEEAMLRTCASFGVTAYRVPGRSGVWLPEGTTPDGVHRSERKVGAIGLRVSQHVTMHGIALNCDVDLGWYERFIPCGITDAGVTTLSLEAGRQVTVAEALPVLRGHLADLLSWSDYEAGPSLAPKPDPAKTHSTPRVPVLTPSSL